VSKNTLQGRAYIFGISSRKQAEAVKKIVLSSMFYDETPNNQKTSLRRVNT